MSGSHPAGASQTPPFLPACLLQPKSASLLFIHVSPSQRPACNAWIASAASSPASQSAEAECRSDDDLLWRYGELPDGVSTFEGPGDAPPAPCPRAGESEQLFSLLDGATWRLPSATAFTRPDGAANVEARGGVVEADAAAVVYDDEAAAAGAAIGAGATYAGAATAGAAKIGRARVALAVAGSAGVALAAATTAALAAATAAAAVAVGCTSIAPATGSTGCGHDAAASGAAATRSASSFLLRPSTSEAAAMSSRACVYT